MAKEETRIRETVCAFSSFLAHASSLAAALFLLVEQPVRLRRAVLQHCAAVVRKCDLPPSIVIPGLVPGIHERLMQVAMAGSSGQARG